MKARDESICLAVKSSDDPSNTNNRSYKDFMDRTMRPVYLEYCRRRGNAAALLYTALALFLGIPLLLISDSNRGGTSPLAHTKVRQPPECVPIGEIKEANMTLILPEFSQDRQGDVESLFVETYNHLSGACEGPFQRVLTKASLLSMDPTGHYRMVTTWKGRVSCHGCSDVEPIFNLDDHGLNWSEPTLTGGMASNESRLEEDFRKNFVMKLQVEMRAMELVPPKPPMMIDRRYLEEDRSNCRYDNVTDGGNSDGSAKRKLQMRPTKPPQQVLEESGNIQAQASPGEGTLDQPSPEESSTPSHQAPPEESGSSAVRISPGEGTLDQPSSEEVANSRARPRISEIDPDCDDRRHFFWIPEEEPESESPSSAPSYAPTMPRRTITLAPTRPTSAPSLRPTLAPTLKPTTVAPSREPTTAAPSSNPTTVAPSLKPTTLGPSRAPTSSMPTTVPTTLVPSLRPSTLEPTLQPVTPTPTIVPTAIGPSYTPTEMPTISLEPSVSLEPSISMQPSTSAEPSQKPSVVKGIDDQRGDKITLSPTTNSPTTSAPTLRPTAAATSTSPSLIPSGGPSAMQIQSPTESPVSESPSEIPTIGLTSTSPTMFPSGLPTVTLTESPTEAPVSGSPSVFPSVVSTESPTEAPTTLPPTTGPTVMPSPAPTAKPTEAPSALPTTPSPTNVPTITPTKSPTSKPTETPTASPVTPSPTTTPTTEAPTAKPSDKPTEKPTAPPTNKPTEAPSAKPTNKPTETPSAMPVTQSPTKVPTMKPTEAPTAMPVTQSPTATPTLKPTARPTTASPTRKPTPSPSATFTSKYVATPRPTTAAPTTPSPTMKPSTMSPTVAPTTMAPTQVPSTRSPTMIPTTPSPTLSPTTISPTMIPTIRPTTTAPTRKPTEEPTTLSPTTLLPTTLTPTTLSPTNVVRKVPTFFDSSMEPSLGPSASVEPSFSMEPSVSIEPSVSAEPSRLPLSLPPSTLTPTTLTPTSLTPTTLTPTTLFPTTLSPVTMHPTTTFPSLAPSALPSLSPSAVPTKSPIQKVIKLPTHDVEEPCDDRRHFYWIPLPEEDTPDTPPPIGRSPGELELLHHCIHSKILVDEDFEKEGSEESWTHGSSSYSQGLTFFLGRLDGQYNPSVSQKFDITPAPDGSLASSATIEFVLYTIDDWTPEDAISVVIGPTTIRFEQFESSTLAPAYSTDAIDGISWWRNIIMQGSNLGFGPQEDKKHLLEFTIPSDHFPGGTLYFEVRIETERGGVETLSAGVDDFILEAYYNCRGLSNRALEETAGARETEVAESAQEDEMTKPYCSADDFPCHGGSDMVFICHYSDLRGHKTLCIHEMSSRALQYYVHDYCGPCVGSFRGSSWLR